MMRRDLKAYEWDGLAFRLSPCGVEFMHLSLLDCLCPGCGLFGFIEFSLDWFGTFSMVVGCSVMIFGCLFPGYGRGRFFSPLPGVWAWISLVGCLLALSVGSGLLLMVL